VPVVELWLPVEAVISTPLPRRSAMISCIPIAIAAEPQLDVEKSACDPRDMLMTRTSGRCVAIHSSAR
jgi:hypothetical protein